MPLTATPGTAIQQLVSKGLSNAASFVFPPLCIVCELQVSIESRWLCNNCLSALRLNHLKRKPCSRCGQNRNLRGCDCAKSWDEPYESIYSVFDFDPTIKTLAHQFKYNNRPSLARELGARCGSLLPAGYFDRVDMLIPVPLHFLRRWSRGYNQAEQLARGIIDTLGQSVLLSDEILFRKRYTKTQTAINKSGRQQNMANAFDVRESKKQILQGKHIILVDDVVTTGATTASCARALTSAGCASVKVLSLARD